MIKGVYTPWYWLSTFHSPLWKCAPCGDLFPLPVPSADHGQ